MAMTESTGTTENSRTVSGALTGSTEGVGVTFAVMTEPTGSTESSGMATFVVTELTGSIVSPQTASMAVTEQAGNSEFRDGPPCRDRTRNALLLGHDRVSRCLGERCGGHCPPQEECIMWPIYSSWHEEIKAPYSFTINTFQLL